ncbi:MAG: hypothetical protein ACK5HR_02555 [Mycoplasmatales bacterium]
MSLINKYIYEFNNEYLKYLYVHDSEILISTHIRGCLLLTISDIKYAVPFRSNMRHKNGILLPIGRKNFGLDFSKAIPIIDLNVLIKKDFKLTKPEELYYNKIEHYIMVVFKFEQYLNNIYYENKKHNTHHKILAYAQKFKRIKDLKNIHIYNESKTKVEYLTDILEYQTLYRAIDKIFINKIQDLHKIKLILEANNVNIFIYIN